MPLFEVPAAPPAVDSGELCPRIVFAVLAFFFFGVLAARGSVPVLDVPTAPPAVDEGALLLCAFATETANSVAIPIKAIFLIMSVPWVRCVRSEVTPHYQLMPETNCSS